MTDLLSHMLDAPVANILVLAGLAFLAIGVLGKISGKIEPGTSSRILSGVLGVALLVYGIYAHAAADSARHHVKRTSENLKRQPPQSLVERTSDSQPSGAAAEYQSAEEPVKMSSSQNPLSGVWQNDNPRTRGITRLNVQQRNQLVIVHAWAVCARQNCDWGAAKGVLRGESASIPWDQGFVLRKMTLFPDGGRLRMELDSVYRDDEPQGHRVEYFVRSQ